MNLSIRRWWILGWPWGRLLWETWLASMWAGEFEKSFGARSRRVHGDKPWQTDYARWVVLARKRAVVGTVTKRMGEKAFMIRQ